MKCTSSGGDGIKDDNSNSPPPFSSLLYLIELPLSDLLIIAGIKSEALGLYI